MDWTLELVVVPVADVDRAKAFYIEQAGFDLLVDHRAGDDFRVVQLTPPGSACAIAVMANPEAAGSVHGLHLIVSDIDVARSELVERGTQVSEIFHFESGNQVPGPDPERSNYGSFFSFSDPDGNSWLVQEVRRAESVPDGAVHVVGFDHVVLNVADLERTLAFYCGELGLTPARVDEWRRGEAPFPSARVNDHTVIDFVAAPRTGENVNHVCLVVAPTDLDALKASGRFEVTDGPGTRWGAQGNATSLYIRDPDGNTVELRYYP